MATSPPQHSGICTGLACPMCRAYRLWAQRTAQASLASSSGSNRLVGHARGLAGHGSKPNIPLTELVARRRRCRDAKSKGQPCPEEMGASNSQTQRQVSENIPEKKEGDKDSESIWSMQSIDSNQSLAGVIGRWTSEQKQEQEGQEIQDVHEENARNLGGISNVLSVVPASGQVTAQSRWAAKALKVRFAYGVTTVLARKKELFPKTLASLKRAGFDKPRLFIDGINASGVREYEEEYGLNVTPRDVTIRTYGNWFLALNELYIREPNADRYALFQDDFVTYLGLREYLSVCKYPERGYMNLYNFPQNEKIAPRGQGGSPLDGWYESNQCGRGAVALVFNREAVKVLLCSLHMVERPEDAVRGHKAVDGGVVTAMRKAGWKEYVHYPSLVQHTGLYSSMGNSSHKQSESWRGEEFDVRRLLG